jgi:hypothetical protein
MAGKAGQIIPRGERTWLVRVLEAVALRVKQVRHAMGVESRRVCRRERAAAEVDDTNPADQHSRSRESRS